MCEECEAHLKTARREAREAAREAKEEVSQVEESARAEEKNDAEHEVSPQTNATMTVLTPAPDAGIASTPSLESLINSRSY